MAQYDHATPCPPQRFASTEFVSLGPSAAAKRQKISKLRYPGKSEVLKLRMETVTDSHPRCSPPT